MKKTIIHISTILAVLFMTVLSQSCSSTIDEGNMGSFPYLSIPEQNIKLDKSGQTVEVPVETNREVKTTCNADWLKASFKNNKVTIQVTENYLEISRQAEVSLTTGYNSINGIIYVSQDESGVHTFTGNAIIASDSELGEFVKKYTRISGNLILGSMATGKTPNATRPQASGSELTDISGISALTEITGAVTVANNPNLRDISALKKFGMVKDLTISNNPNLDSIGFIQDMRITSLTVTHSSSYSKYEPVVNTLTDLTYLNISNNSISEIDSIANMNKLRTLVLGSGAGETNTIYSLTPLYDLDSLRNLDISGLPISASQIEEFKSYNSACNVTAEDMKAGVAILGKPAVSGKSETALTVTCEIKDKGYGEISETGFYFGETLTDMTKIPCSYTANAITLTKSNLQSAKAYYFYAYVVNTAGTSRTETVEAYTLGVPKISTEISATATDTQIQCYGKLDFNGGTTAECGTIIGTDKGLDLSHNLDIYTVTANKIENFEWNNTFEDLNSGHRYYIRFFATNSYGTVYSDVMEVGTTGVTNIPMSELRITLDVPKYQNQTDDVIPVYDRLSGTVLRNDLMNYNGIISATAVSSVFTFSLYDGQQDIIFYNIDHSGTSLIDVSTESSSDDVLSFSMTGNSGLGSDIILAVMKDLTITGNTERSASASRLTSELSVKMYYADEYGNNIVDLSEIISSINVKMDGIADQCSITNTLTPLYQNTSYLNFALSDIPASDHLQICDGIHTFPSLNNSGIVYTVDITFTDGQTSTIKSSGKPVSANNRYDIELRITELEGSLSGTFELEIIENIDEEIEF